MLIAIIGNFLVLAAILRTPSLSSPSTVYLCSLAVSDLLVGLVVQPVYIPSALQLSFSTVDAYNILTVSACGVSLFTMATISIDRFPALHYHIRYLDLMTTKRAIYISATLWLICALLSCSYFLSQRVFFLAISVGIAICLRNYGIVHHHQLQIQAQQQAVESTEHNLNMVRSKKSAINTFIYFVCIILCYTPRFISTLVSVVLFENELIAVRTLTTTLVFLNSTINPFLYCWRVAVLKTLRKVLCKHTEGT